jgi:outer membrane receptor for ferrienterochelin and colicins
MAPSRYDAYGAYADDEYYRTKRSQTRLLMEGKLGKNGRWQSQNAYSLYYRTKNSYVTDLVTLNQTLNQSQEGVQDTSRFDDINLRANYTNKVWKLHYTVGYDVALQYAHSQKISDNNREMADYAAFGNLSMPFFKEKLTAQIGLRAAYNTRYHSPVIPSFNLLYHAADNVQLRASYARGFRTPSLKELYLEFIDLNHHITGNDNLQAESADHYQASASWQFYKSGSDYAQFILTGYYNDVTNGIALVNQDTANPNSINYTYGNINRVQNAIANFQTELQLRNVNLQLGYGFTHTFAQSGQYDAFDVHDVTANMQYAWVKKKLHFSLFYKLTGSQPALQSNIDGSATYNGRMPAYSMLDASVERKFWNKKLQVIVGVKNILNVQTLNASGAAAVNMGPHGGSSQLDMMPRRLFTTLRLTLD